MSRNINRQNGVLVKRNEFIKAGFNLSINEYRLINLCIAKIDSTREMPESIVLDRETILSIFPVMKNNYYRDISKLVARLYARNISFIVDDNNEIHRNIRWLQEEAHYNNGIIELVFSNRIVKYISSIDKSGFTKFKIEHMSDFNSVYSIRIYEHMKMHTNFQKIKRKKESIKFTYKQLRGMFQLENKYILNGKPNDREIKRNVVDMAVREIAKKCNVKINARAVYQGRRAVGVVIEYETRMFHSKSKTPAPVAAKEELMPMNSLKHLQNELELRGNSEDAAYLRDINNSLEREKIRK